MPRLTVKQQELEKKIVKESTVFVKRTVGENGKPPEIDDEELETIGIHEFVTPPAEVGVNMGLTISLGGYNMARIDVIAKRPCYVEEMDAYYDQVAAFTEKRIKDDVRKIKSFNKGSGSREDGPGF